MASMEFASFRVHFEWNEQVCRFHSSISFPGKKYLNFFQSFNVYNLMESKQKYDRNSHKHFIISFLVVNFIWKWS